MSMKRTWVVGRAESCDLVVNERVVSKCHCRLVQSADGVHVEDLRSTNGTFLNGLRVQGPVLVGPGDCVTLGKHLPLPWPENVQPLAAPVFRDSATPCPPQLAARAPSSRSVRQASVEARQVAVACGRKQLLEPLSLAVFPGELTGLMGPSGAGKSTLLNVLNGYTCPAQGEVLINGLPLAANFPVCAPLLGYVPQDDVLHPQLTVAQAIYLTARLRLASQYSDAVIRRRIDLLLHALELEAVRSTPIGSPEKRGISGGERKRVNLAMELVTDPLVLFLDEPTSGLSSREALGVMATLRRLADAGKTVLVTIHQPSREAFRLLDNLIVISKDKNRPGPGKLLYFGRACPDAIQFFNPASATASDDAPAPESIFTGLETRPAAAWQEAYRQSECYGEFVTRRVGKAARLQGDATLSLARPRPTATSQCFTLMRRLLAIKAGDLANSVVMLLQAPAIAALVVLVYGQDLTQEVTTFEQGRKAAAALAAVLFLMSLAALWFGCCNAVREIVGEAAVFRRERMVNLRLLPYACSKLTFLGAVSLLQCLVLSAIVHAGCNLCAPWIAVFGLVWLGSLAGAALGLVLSAAARTTEVAVALVPVVLLPLIILGGVLQPLHQMHAVMRQPAQAVPTRWVFEGLLVLECEAGGKNRLVPAAGPPVAPAIAAAQTAPVPTAPVQDMAEGYFPKAEGRRHPGGCAAIVAGMGVALFVLLLWLLERRSQRQRGWLLFR